MKKHFIILALMSIPFTTHSGWVYSLFGLKPDKRTVSWGTGLSVYTMSRLTPFDDDPQEVYTRKVTPQSFLNMQWHWEGKPSLHSNKEGVISLGLEASFAYRKKGIQTDIINLTSNVAYAILKQDVRNFSITPFVEYQFYKNKKVTCALTGGMPLAFKPVGKLKWHQRDHFANGFYLQPKKFHLFMNLGMNFIYTTDNNYTLKWGYSYMRGKVRYYNGLYMNQPDTGAEQIYHTIYPDYTHGDLFYNKPKGTLNYHGIKLSIIKDF